MRAIAKEGIVAVKEVKLEGVGDVEDIEVVEVLVSVGDEVKKEDPLVTLESDKATMEFPSPYAGTVKEVKVEPNQSIKVGAVICTIEVSGEAGEAAEEKPAEKKEAKTGEKKKEPRREEREEGASEEEEASDEGAREKPERRSTPKEAKRTRQEIEEAMPEEREGVGRRVSPANQPLEYIYAQKTPPGEKPHASPAVRRLAREFGVDLSQVDGSGRKERILTEDVKAYVRHVLSETERGRRAEVSGPSIDTSEQPDIDFTQFGDVRVEPLTKIQRISGRNLARAWRNIPHVTQHDEADITELEEFRKGIIEKQKREGEPVKLTILAFFCKAIVTCLREYPKFRSSLDKTGQNLVVKDYYHVGVAVDTERGLVVPVIRDVNYKGLVDIARELKELSEKARDRKLSPMDMQGACISISSLGGIGGTAFTPIINPPEVAVLGVSQAKWQPVWKDGEFIPRLICPLSLSYDHRVIDGADAARFTTYLKDVLTDVRRMLL